MRKTIRKTAAKLLLAMSVGATGVVSANEVELSISDELIDLRFTNDFEQNFHGKLGLMHSDVKENNTDINTNYVSYQFYTQDTVDRFDLQLGAKAFWLDVEDDDGFGIALGAGVAFAVIDKLSLGLDVYYTPDVISSGDIENTLDIDLRLAYQMLENGQLFIGYRRFDADFEKGDVDIYDDAYFGVKFSF